MVMDDQSQQAAGEFKVIAFFVGITYYEHLNRPLDKFIEFEESTRVVSDVTNTTITI